MCSSLSPQLVNGTSTFPPRGLCLSALSEVGGGGMSDSAGAAKAGMGATVPLPLSQCMLQGCLIPGGPQGAVPSPETCSVLWESQRRERGLLLGLQAAQRTRVGRSVLSLLYVVAAPWRREEGPLNLLKSGLNVHRCRRDKRSFVRLLAPHSLEGWCPPPLQIYFTRYPFPPFP